MKLWLKLSASLLITSLVAVACTIGDPSSPGDSKKLDDPRLPRKINSQKADLGHAYISRMNDGQPHLNNFVLENLPRVWEPAEQNKFLTLSTEAKKTLIYEYYGLVNNPYDTRLAMGFNLNTRGGWVMNCASCHSGTIGNRTQIGLGNIRFDQSLLITDIYKTRLLLAAEGTDPVAVLGPLSPIELNLFDNISKTANNLIYDTVFLFSLRNPDLSLRRPLDPVNPEPPLDLGDYLPAPVDVPAWWNLKKKARLYSLNISTYSARSIMQFFMGMFNMQQAEISALENQFENITHYIDSLEASTVVGDFPGTINASLANRGKIIFKNTCSRCHGTYGENWIYPELVVRIDDVGTDPALLESITEKFTQHSNQSWFNNYGANGSKLYGQSPGYVAQPLDGIWATAPYLHNGSVPTLAQLIGLEERPTIWQVSDYINRDLRQVGLQIETVNEIPTGLSQRDYRTYYDTTRYGSGNAGHEYANELSRSEKVEVLEYLKTL